MASINRRLRRAEERGKDTSYIRLKVRSHGGRLKAYQNPYSINLYADRMEDESLNLNFMTSQRGKGLRDERQGAKSD